MHQQELKFVAPFSSQHSSILQMIDTYINYTLMLKFFYNFYYLHNYYPAKLDVMLWWQSKCCNWVLLCNYLVIIQYFSLILVITCFLSCLIIKNKISWVRRARKAFILIPTKHGRFGGASCWWEGKKHSIRYLPPKSWDGCLADITTAIRPQPASYDYAMIND